MKYLFLKEGWTAESFLAELQSRLDFTLLPAAPEQVPDDVFRDHAGIHPQRQPGFSYVGASVLRGRLTGEQLQAAAELAERFGSRRAAHHRLAKPALHRHSQSQNRRTGARAERRSACKSRAPPSGAAPSPAPARSSASWPSPRPKASPAGWSMSWKSACRSSTSSSGSTSPAAPTAAASTGSPTSASKARRSSTTASSSTPTISASAARWASTRPLRGRWAIAALRRWFRKPSSGCCATTSPAARRKKICAPGSAATPTTSCAHIWPERFCAPVERDLPAGRVPHGVAD